jgi:ADP-ribose pyrophosphatase YjhB (NUDIX family)/GNAT superfamily N-acetyltransferase
MWHRDGVAVRPAVEADREWIERTLVERWGSTLVVVRGRPLNAATLEALVAVAAAEEGDPEPAGLLTYRRDDEALEVVTIDSLRPGEGIGRELLEQAARVARQSGAKRLWLITTNDNLHAVGFYQRQGLRIVAVHRGAVGRARLLKPAIPLVAGNGIELHDELELELALPAAAPTARPVPQAGPAPQAGPMPTARPVPQARPVPTAGVVIRDGEGRLLLVKRADDGTWCLPGGRLEPGESWAACAVRECREETGLAVALRGLFGVYSEPRDQVHTYPDGDRIQVTGVVFTAEVLDGEVLPVDAREITSSGYFARDSLPGEIMGCDAPIVADAFSGDAAPFVR